MNKMKLCAKWVVPAIVAAFFVAPASAATCTSITNGNWNVTTTWGLLGLGACGGVIGAIPTAADDVIISNGNTVTVNAAGLAANSVTIAGGGSNTTLTFNAGSSLAVTNDVIINQPTTSNRSKRITVLTGTLTVGGNVTLNGGTAATRDALLSASTGSITINGGLTVNATVATSSTVQLTSTGAVTVNGAAGVTNGDSVIIGTGTFNVTNASSTFTNSSATNVVTTSISSGTLNVAGNLVNAAGETVTVSSTGNINVGGNWSNSGTFSRGTGTVTFNGTAAQTLGGAATTTFNNLIINKASGDVTINSASVALSPTVNAALTLTSGHVITTVGTNDLGLGTAGTVSGGSAASHVVGAVQKNYAAFGTLTFPVGDGTNYTPVVIQGTAGFTAGSLTINTTGGDHPSIASSGIDSTKSVNRYWTLTPTGLPASTYNATFNYINGSPVDFDTGATPANFIVEQWNGTSWFPTTLAGSCTATPATNLCEQITGETGFGDFAIGEPLSGFNGVPGAFNTFEASTQSNAILGRIYTKIVGAPITLQVVAVNAGRTGVNVAYNTNPITVDLLDARDNTGALSAATNCRTTWTTVISTQSLSPVWTSGRSATVAITTPVNAWRDVRVRVTQGANVGCSTDRFAIRPTAFSSITSTANNNTTGAGTTIKTGQNFTISVLTALTGYDNGSGATLANPALIPLVDNTSGMVVGSPYQGTIGGTFGAASGGTASGTSFYYSEVGNFGLSANAIYDNVFTAVDQPSDCVTAAGSNFSNTANANGEYGCNFGSPAVALASGFGRFIPDNFAVSYNLPQFSTVCGTGGFSYVGQLFNYGTKPVLTVTARNGTTNGLANATTTNYAGAYMKFSNTVGTSLNQAPYNTQAGRYSRFDALGGGATPALDISALPLTTADPTIGSFTKGVGTLTFSAGATGLAFTRNATTPSAPFNADIALALNIIDGDGVAYAGTASFGAATSGNGIAFSTGKAFRYGRLKLSNAYGSELLNLPVSIQTQYWNGTGFVINAADNCTTLAASNIKLTAPPAGVSATMGGAFSSGVGSLTLSKPTTPANVAVDLCVDLGVDPPVGSGTQCSATVANLPYLQGLWPPGTSYNNDPVARATFGVYKGSNQFIYMREAY